MISTSATMPGKRALLSVALCAASVVIAAPAPQSAAAGALVSGATSTATPAAASPGTNIIDDQDSSVGLFVAPWQDVRGASADRAPRLYDVKPQPVDLATQRARVELEERIDAGREARLAGHE